MGIAFMGFIHKCYARIDGRTRNEAIEKCSSILDINVEACWKEDDELRKYLKTLGRT